MSDMGSPELFLLALIAATYAFIIWMLVEAIRVKRIYWIIGMILLGLFAAVPYYFVEYRNRPKS